MAIMITAAIMIMASGDSPIAGLLDVGEGEDEGEAVGDENGKGDWLGVGDGECDGDSVG
jgi:hypothetical protein